MVKISQIREHLFIAEFYHDYFQMMLGLATHDPHFSLLREEVRFGGKKDRNKRYLFPFIKFFTPKQSQFE